MDPTLPAARIVKQAGAVVAAPRVPLRVRLSPAIGHARTLLGILLAFWPITAIVLFTVAVLLSFSSHAGP